MGVQSKQLSRRSLIKRGLFGGLLLTGAGGLRLLTLGGARVEHDGPALQMSAAEHATLLAIAQTLIPGDPSLPTLAQVGFIEKVDFVLQLLHPADRAEVGQVLTLIENALSGLLFEGRPVPFSRASKEAQARTLRSWRDSRLLLRRSGFKAVRTMVVAAYYGTPEAGAALGYPGPPDLTAAQKRP